MINHNTLSVTQAFNHCKKNDQHIILDVRTASEWSLGVPLGSTCLELNNIKHSAKSTLSIKKHYYLICQTSQRSMIALEQLIALGFSNVYLIKEGYQEWLKQGLPTEIPTIENNDLRYQRHYQLKGFGRKSQEKLNNAHVLLIGAGGLGSSSALYLAAAGIGQLTIIDDDIVSLSNLQRQIIHTTDSIGSLKVDSAHKQLSALNPEIVINTVAQRLDKDNVGKLVENVDIVIDGSDNLETRYLVNDTCLQYKRPLVYAAVYQYEAQISTFNFAHPNTPCLRCLFPQTEGFEPANCTTEGVLGVVPGLAGIMQATEVIKLISGIGESLSSTLFIVDLLDNSFRKITYSLDKNCQNH